MAFNNSSKALGTLEVICGPMFSGKTEELIRRLRRAVIAKQRVMVFKHCLDDRFCFDHLTSHSGDKLEAQPIDTPERLFDHIQKHNADVIGIDEVQFFPATIIYTIDELVSQGKRVIVAGLDLDFRCVPFGPIPTLLAIADTITKLKSICTICGSDAAFSQRLINGQPAKHDDPIILVGAEENYQARCRACYCIDQFPFKLQKECCCER
jgi:thymidine kinase